MLILKHKKYIYCVTSMQNKKNYLMLLVNVICQDLLNF